MKKKVYLVQVVALCFGLSATAIILTAILHQPVGSLRFVWQWVGIEFEMNNPGTN